MASRREKYPDILLAQLLETSTEFRNWFVGQSNIDTAVDQHIGVRCNESKGGRETDVLFGFEGLEGKTHLVLIENKIKAQVQPSQLSDYHNRGESYVNREQYDAYNVCLIAPEDWLSSDYDKKVDSIILYEDVIDRLESSEYDGASFIKNVFEECAADAGSSVPDFTNVTSEIWARVRQKTDEKVRGRPGKQSATAKNVRCTSLDPNHPQFFIYRLYIGTPNDHGNTNIILEVDFSESTILEKYELDQFTLKAKFGESIVQNLREKHPGLMEDYEHAYSSENTVILTELNHNTYSGFPNEDYYQAVVKEFCDLVDKVHPIIIDMDFERLAKNIA